MRKISSEVDQINIKIYSENRYKYISILSTDKVEIYEASTETNLYTTTVNRKHQYCRVDSITGDGRKFITLREYCELENIDYDEITKLIYYLNISINGDVFELLNQEYKISYKGEEITHLLPIDKQLELLQKFIEKLKGF